MTLKAAALLFLTALSACTPPGPDACQTSGYDPGICADEQSRRAAAIAILGNMRPIQPYQQPVYQMQNSPVQQPMSRTCNSMPNFVGGFYTNCY